MEGREGLDRNGCERRSGREPEVGIELLNAESERVVLSTHHCFPL